MLGKSKIRKQAGDQTICKHHELDKSKLVKARNKESQNQNNVSNEQKHGKSRKYTLSLTSSWVSVLCVLRYCVVDRIQVCAIWWLCTWERWWVLGVIVCGGHVCRLQVVLGIGDDRTPLQLPKWRGWTSLYVTLFMDRILNRPMYQGLSFLQPVVCLMSFVGNHTWLPGSYCGISPLCWSVNSFVVCATCPRWGVFSYTCHST